MPSMSHSRYCTRFLDSSFRINGAKASISAMELTAAMSVAWALVVAFIVFVLVSSIAWPLSQRKALKLPPGPRGWPVFGSLGLLAGKLPPHRTLAALAARHGPLMHLRLGSFHVVVASSAETARLVLKTHDAALADRPPTAAGEIMAYGRKGILLTPYGAYWRMARKLCATELFSPRRLDLFERARAEETRALVRALFERCAAGRAGAGGVEVREHLESFGMRNILRMAVGERWSGLYGSEDGAAFRASLREVFAVSGAVNNVGEWVPWLGRLDVQGFARRMRRVRVLFDRFYEQILDEHEEERRRWCAGSGAAAGEVFAGRDLVDVLLQIAEEDKGAAGESESRLTRDGIKGFIQDIIAGGTETTAATMEWALAELLRHPNTMAAAVEELDRVVGRHNRWATERDLPELPYIDAVVKETLRLHPPGPLLVPHHAREDAVVAGFDVPAGTRVLVNVWAVGRDPASWPDAPDAFRPERFLPGGAAHGVDMRGAHFELLPFGSGRRICPGYNLAVKEVAGTLANLLLGFAWRLPDGVAPEDVNMDEFLGLTMRREVPLVAVAEPRLPAHLYTVAAG